MRLVQQPLPLAFREQMIDLLGVEVAESLFFALETPPPTSIRLNLTKAEVSTLHFSGLEPVPWCAEGYYLPERPSFVADPLWHAGAYYVQEASSMLIACIRPLLGEHPLTALDLCASPGGKSTLLHALLPEGSLLVSNEYVHSRAVILRENILKWGAPRSMVTHAAAEELGRLREAFDLILVDAPCSGEGMFRKDMQARAEWSSEAVESCARRQWSILEDVWPALRPGGLLIYSTCTMNRRENEDILELLVEEFDAQVLELPECPREVMRSAIGNHVCYRMMPHQTRGEGLFACFVRKPADSLEAEERIYKRKSKNQSRNSKTNEAIPVQIKGWIQNPTAYEWIQTSKGEVFAWDKAYGQLLEQIQRERIQILAAGIPVALLKGKSSLPHPALAHSISLEPSAFPNVELSHWGAIRFLSGEAITLPLYLDKGWYTVSFEGVKLGFVKHLGNRSNNHYPDEWRIRQSQTLYEQITQEPDTIELD